MLDGHVLVVTVKRNRAHPQPLVKAPFPVTPGNKSHKPFPSLGPKSDRGGRLFIPLYVFGVPEPSKRDCRRRPRGRCHVFMSLDFLTGHMLKWKAHYYA